ncbi:esterase/lipase family protein [Novosphingobium album (ex Hu et al. 2023)]|uniref:Alpha/beta hydrolase n=1 Tax=Novosphingobium album (ex Hu et al. 2023) TaxID=2930093 RepID=A0ABT0AW32_9SPHN|nr:alpha/beta fold hydrolase [Novosphingobium album (ex Hu et al. 2023)]MCJ2176960.1 alpha/beta hydrolase [Novosphingobium album (ex Hu et al. 2023)]
MARIESPIQAPFLGLAFLELGRSLMEAASTLALSPVLAMAPRGDGHPVVVLPGFATSDSMTVLLRSFLSLQGYDVHPMDLGWNFDHHTVGENGEHIAERIRVIRQETGRKVSLVGWSLGGVIAREAARRDPEDLRQVISLGSPFSGDPHATNLKSFYQFATGNDFSSEKMQERYRNGPRVLPIPSTAVFSRTDGITAWENCIGDSDEINENVEVVSSHFGFVTNPAVFQIIADRLSQPEGKWQRFVPRTPLSSVLD